MDNKGGRVLRRASWQPLYAISNMASTNKWDNLPSFDELPPFKNYPGCAWDVWGKGDELGTVNLLTDDVVTEAAKEIKYVEFSPHLVERRF